MRCDEFEDQIRAVLAEAEGVSPAEAVSTLLELGVGLFIMAGGKPEVLQEAIGELVEGFTQVSGTKDYRYH